MKLYQSKVWLTKKYVNDRMTIDEIAAVCNVTPRTIYNKLNEYNLPRK